MFEQSFLTNPAGTRKTATFAASLTAQIVVAGVLVVVVPLFYHDVLPAFQIPAFVPPLALWRPPEAPVTEMRSTSRSSALALPGVFRPPTVIRSEFPQASFAVVDYDTPLNPTVPAIALPVGTSTLPRYDGPPMTTPVKPDVVQPPATPVRVGGSVQSAKLIKQVVPVYPQLARQMRISGTVQLLGVIAKGGTIQKLQVLSGHPLLRQAALDAVSQWVYRPTILNGQPVEVEAPIAVIFSLSR